MLEHVEKTLNELKEHRQGVITYLENIDNAIGVLEKMNAVITEAERLLKGSPEPDTTVTGTPEKPKPNRRARGKGSRSKSGLPKGVFRRKYAGDKPDRFEAQVWDGKEGKNVRLGLYDTIEEACETATKARNNVSLKKATSKATTQTTVEPKTRIIKGGQDNPVVFPEAKEPKTFFKCPSCRVEYKELAGGRCGCGERLEGPFKKATPR